MATQAVNANGIPDDLRPPEGLDDKEFSAWLLGKQRAMQQEAQLFSTASNILNMRHQMAMGAMEKVGQSGRG